MGESTLEASTLGEPTKVIIRKYDEQSRVDEETTYGDLCSVEIGTTVTGAPQIKSVKVYAPTAYQASVEALETFRRLQDALAPGPDLLDALVGLVDWVEDPDVTTCLGSDVPVLSAAYAAIAKAQVPKGEERKK